MNKFKFKPYSYRIGNLEISNFYLNKETNKKSPLQSHLSKNYEYFEILKWESNYYYGKEYLYEESQGGEFYVLKGHPNCRIDKNCFKNPESCYVLAFFGNVYDDDSLNIETVGDRPFKLTIEEFIIFKDLVNKGFKEILKQINKYES